MDKILKALLWMTVGVEVIGACVLDAAITRYSKDHENDFEEFIRKHNNRYNYD